MNELTTKIEQWATERNLHTADPTKQMLKLIEEVGEIASGMARGDVQVVLTILSMRLGTTLDDERNEYIEWLLLWTGWSPQLFNNKTDKEILNLYERYKNIV